MFVKYQAAEHSDIIVTDLTTTCYFKYESGAERIMTATKSYLKNENVRPEGSIVFMKSKVVGKQVDNGKQFVATWVRKGTFSPDEAKSFYRNNKANYTLPELDIGSLQRTYLRRFRIELEVSKVRPRPTTNVEQYLFSTFGQVTLRNVYNRTYELAPITYLDNVYSQLDKGWFIADKYHGVHALLIFEEEHIVIVTQTSMERRPHVSSNVGHMLEGELMDNGELYIFDYLGEVGRPTSLKYEKRLEKASELINGLSKVKLKSAFKISKVEDIKTFFKEISLAESMPTDGVIFTPGFKDYQTSINYKWKPLKDRTIDLKMIDLDGKCTYWAMDNTRVAFKTKTWLPDFNPVNPNMPTIDVPFCPIGQPWRFFSNCPQSMSSGQVGEFYVDKDKLELIRIRDDKTKGNHIDSINNMFPNYFLNFSEDTLWDVSKLDSYWVTNKKDPRRAFVKAVRDAKHKPIFEYLEEKGEPQAVLDIACGRGSTLGVIIDKTRMIHAIDNDWGALQEYTKRHRSNTGRIAGLQTVYMDLTDAFSRNNFVEKLRQSLVNTAEDYKYSLVLYHLAVHYNFPASTYEQVAKQLAQVTRKGGSVVMSFMSRANTKTFKSEDHDIKRDGTEAEIYFPFSNKSEREHLIDWSKFNNAMQLSGWKLTYRTDMYTEGLKEDDSEVLKMYYVCSWELL